MYIISNNSTLIDMDLLGLEYYNDFKMKSLREIIKSRGVLAYTGTTISRERLEELKTPSDEEIEVYNNADKETKNDIKNNIRIRYIAAKLGIETTNNVTYENGCGHAPIIDVKTETLIPYDLKMTHRGHISLFFHEANRSTVYENIYNNYIKPIELIKCSFRYSEFNMNKFKQFYINSLNKALTTAWFYAKRQLGDGKYSIGIDKENENTLFEDQNGHERNWRDFLHAYLSDENVKKSWVFHGFKMTHKVAPPTPFIAPVCPSFN